MTKAAQMTELWVLLHLLSMRRPLLIVKACNFQSKHHKIIIDLFCIKNKETEKLDIWCVMH